MSPETDRIVNEHPGVGLMVADNIACWLRDLTQYHPLLAGDNGKYKEDLQDAAASLWQCAECPGATLEEVREAYQALTLALSLVRDDASQGASLHLFRAGGITRMPSIPDLPPFEEIVDTVVAEIQNECPAEGQNAAVDSVIMGEIKLRDIYLPLQAEIRKKVLDQLKSTSSVKRKQPGEVLFIDGKDVVTVDNENTAIEALSLLPEDMQKEVLEGRLEENVVRIIGSTRSDIRRGLGASGLTYKERLIAIRKSRIAAVSMEKIDAISGKMPLKGSTKLSPLAERVFKAREARVMGKTPVFSSERTSPERSSSRLRLVENFPTEPEGPFAG
jgi:hypothetical protein